LAIDSAGNVFVADTDNNRIRKITAGCVVTTIAGSGNPAFADGIGTAASFNRPGAVALNATGNILYVSDRANFRIRRIDLTTNQVTTIAGSGVQGVLDSNTGANARFDTPAAIAVDSNGNICVADQGPQSIRRITPAGAVTTVAGSSPTNYALGMAIDSSNNIYIAEMFGHRITKLTPSGVKTLFSGSGTAGSADGTSSAAQFNRPGALTIDATGTIYVADTDNNRIRKVTSNGAVTTLSLPVTLGQPLGVVAELNGKLYIANTLFNTIIKTVVSVRP
jgi:sugar lactone lactonase YvrE